MRLRLPHAFAALALAVLAAACDRPATLAETEPGGAARLAEAPVLTVSNSGGYPLISWSALSGATSYSVVYRRTRTVLDKQTLQTESETFDSALGRTTGTSFLDAAHAYTGKSNCTSYGTYATVFSFHTYRVTASYADGTSATGTVAAPVAPC